jgi:hypothetical protein
MSSHPAWKKRERQVATFFKSRGRTPLSGINSKHTGADILDDEFYAEVKLRKSHAAMTLLRSVVADSWKEQTWSKALKKKPVVPVVALCEGHKPGFGVLIQSVDVEKFAVAYLTRMGYHVSRAISKGRNIE